MARIECVESADFFIEKDALKIPMHAMHHHASFELYFLAKGEREYFIGDEFFQLTEGDLAPVSCLECGAEPCPKRGECRTLPMWTKLHDMIGDYLDSVTLADLLDGKV